MSSGKTERMLPNRDLDLPNEFQPSEQTIRKHSQVLESMEYLALESKLREVGRMLLENPLYDPMMNSIFELLGSSAQKPWEWTGNRKQILERER